MYFSLAKMEIKIPTAFGSIVILTVRESYIEIISIKVTEACRNE